MREDHARQPFSCQIAWTDNDCVHLPCFAVVVANIRDRRAVLRTLVVDRETELSGPVVAKEIASH